MNPLGGGRAASEGLLERRLVGATLFVFAAFILLAGRLLYLQGVHGDRYRLSAARNSVRTHRLEAPRGIVFDRHGEILVDSRPSFDVLVVPHETGDLERTLARISALTDEDVDRLRERVGDPHGRARFQALPVASDLPHTALARVEANLWSLHGVLTQVSPLRSYTGGELASHVLGSLGEISAAQLESRRYAGYRRGDVIGRQGIEGLLDRSLRGHPGGVNVLVDAHGRELERLDEVRARPGDNAILTLDRRMQRVAEAALDETGRAGAVVALDPTSGEVLVLASRPGFDPNHFAMGLEPGEWQQLVGDPLKPLQNRALQGQYAPGSTYKLVTAIAALEEGVVDTERTVKCTGSYRLGRRRYRCWKRWGHGEVDLHRAIVESCDVFFYQMAREVGVDKLAYYARELGLGAATGIDLGGEAAGLVPTSTWKQRRFGEPWVEGETLSLGIGQGFNLVTPIQLAHVYASVARGGVRWRPYVVREITDPEGAVLEHRSPEVLGQLAISDSTLEIVRHALRGVVHDPHGTGYAMRGLPGGIEAAGKTGTAQVVSLSAEPLLEDEEIPVERRDHAWFVTWVPADEPRLVVAVLVEHGGHGGSAAAPIARRVAEEFLSQDGAVHARR